MATSIQNDETYIPVYVIAGFLESGKTTMVKEMLGDEYFTEGDERTLYICCEEGEEEVDEALLKKANTVRVMLDDVKELDNNILKRLTMKYKPERVIIEYNSVWTLEKLFSSPIPKTWELAQLVCMVDSTTFELYLTNMANMMSEGIKMADCVIINRCDGNTPKSQYRRRVRAMNNNCDIIFDNLDGTSDDGVTDDDLPYDMKADVIEISDENFGIWYLDAMEHPDRYHGRSLKLKGKRFKMDNLPKGAYVFGRNAMTCCANDIQGIGFVCFCEGAMPDVNEWISVVVKAEKSYSPIHDREAITLKQLTCARAIAPKEEVVTFGVI